EDAKARAANFEETWNKALESQRADLQQRFDDAFAEALRGQRPPWYKDREVSTREQRQQAIARLLFALLPVLAEDAISAGSEDDKKLKEAGADPAQRLTALAASNAYKTAFTRYRVVVGLERAARAAREQGQAVRGVLPDLASARAAEKSEFVAA